MLYTVSIWSGRENVPGTYPKWDERKRRKREERKKENGACAPFLSFLCLLCVCVL